MAAAASNVIDLASYRARRARHHPDSSYSSPIPMVHLVWVPVWFVPVMSAESGLAGGGA